MKGEIPITACQRERQRTAVHARDLKRIDAALDRLNVEALDALEYQACDENSDRR